MKVEDMRREMEKNELEEEKFNNWFDGGSEFGSYPSWLKAPIKRAMLKVWLASAWGRS